MSTTAKIGTIDLASIVSKTATETSNASLNDKLVKLYEAALKEKDSMAVELSKVKETLAENVAKLKDRSVHYLQIWEPYTRRKKVVEGEGAVADAIAEMEVKVEEKIRAEYDEKLATLKTKDLEIDNLRTEMANKESKSKETLRIARNAHAVEMNNLKEDHDLALKEARRAGDAALANAKHEAATKADKTAEGHREVVRTLEKKITKLTEELTNLRENKEFATLEKEAKYYRTKATTFWGKVFLGKYKELKA